MTDRFAISSFGGKGLVRAQFIVNEQMQRTRQRLDRTETGSPRRSAVDKWQLLRCVTEAKNELGLSDRAIVVLEALVSFHRERQLAPGETLIVFPSNAELSLRARGMAPATLRRHLAALVEAELILRRDSANGKRYARRSEGGEIEAAFGFDLAPLVLRAGEIEAMAAKARQKVRLLRALRSEITIHLRDIAAIVRTAEEEGRGAAFATDKERLHELSGRLGRNTGLDVLQARRDGLARLRRDVERAYLKGLPEEELKGREGPDNADDSRKMSANDSQNERHIEESESDSNKEISNEKFEVRPPAQRQAGLAVDRWQRLANARPQPVPTTRKPADGGKTAASPALDIATVLSACPQIRDYAPGGLNNWRDLLKAAETVRSMLGILPAAWMRTRREMGDINAAITIAAILERAEAIRSPGGYLHGLTERAGKGKFSVKPMLNALLTERRRQRDERGDRSRTGEGTLPQRLLS